MLLLLLAWSLTGHATSKGMRFFYRLGERVDQYLLQKIDTNYITLPEHSWRVALTFGTAGDNFTIHSRATYEGIPYPLTISLYNRTPLSVDLGFNVGYRGFGFGYSWDVLHAYARRLSFSFGSKFIGIDFAMQTNTSGQTDVAFEGQLLPTLSHKSNTSITNTRLNIWYALNAAHYSHNASIKQSYIQRKTAGSLMLHLSYYSSQIAFGDTMFIKDATIPTIQALMSGVKGMTTRQVAVGLGYGINYTPNQGKVLLHASAAAMLVCYSVNHVTYYLPDSLRSDLPSEPMFALRSSFPVHVTGNVRAAVSWEICPWVHLAAWAIGDNIRFHSEKTANNNELFLSDWNWQVHLTVGVRFGAGKKRVHEALKDEPLSPGQPMRTTKLPKWITGYFYSPSL